MSNSDLSGGSVAGGGGSSAGDMELPDGQLELHVDANRGELLLVEQGGGGGVQSTEEDGLVTEPVLGIRMLMSSRVSITMKQRIYIILNLCHPRSCMCVYVYMYTLYTKTDRHVYLCYVRMATAHTVYCTLVIYNIIILYVESVCYFVFVYGVSIHVYYTQHVCIYII